MTVTLGDIINKKTPAQIADALIREKGHALAQLEANERLAEMNADPSKSSRRWREIQEEVSNECNIRMEQFLDEQETLNKELAGRLMRKRR